MPKGPQTEHPRRPKRWGLRTLGFLALALISVLAAELQQTYTLLTLPGLLLGLAGAAVCSLRGLMSLK